MKYRSYIILIILLSNFSTFAKPVIVTSTNIMGSIITMLTGDTAEVVVISTSIGCPHDYNLKPSDKDSILGADMIVYIDDSFDGYMAKLSEDFKGKVVKISDLSSLNFTEETGMQNWHFWLNLNNIMIISDQLSDILSKTFPTLSANIDKNKDQALKNIETLISKKQSQLAGIENIVIVSDSLGQLFLDTDKRVTKIYVQNFASLKDYYTAQHILKNKEINHCILMDANADDKMYLRYNKKIVKINSENWDNLPTNDGQQFFFDSYNNIIDKVKECSK
ncbi:MAG: metal ABC transporter substrate-binding protein [Rickettsiales bacterium]|nr:metal ABC transporter substrate-binding protein [Rickettsiales bacterium]